MKRLLPLLLALTLCLAGCQLRNRQDSSLFIPTGESQTAQTEPTAAPVQDGADLALPCENREQRIIDGRLKVGIGKDDVRRLAAELEAHALEVADRRLEDFLARHCAARECDLVDARVRAHRCADRRARAEHEIRNAFRKADVLDEAEELDRRQRRDLGGLEHNRVASRERRSELPHRHEQRIVPWDNLGADADGLAHRQRLHVLGHLVRHAHRLRREARIVAQAVACVTDIAFRFAERLAAVEHFEVRELLRLAFELVGEGEEQARPLPRLQRPPR